MWIRRATFKSDDLKHLESALRACNVNIAHNLDNGATIFGHLTGDQCAVSIKTIKEAADGTLLTHGGRRDTTSRETRARVDDIDYDLMENFAFRDIYLGRSKLWVCDDLAKAVTNGKYKNPRPNFGNDYNATIVYPIHKMASSPDSRSPPMPAHTPIAFLCVDNRHGGFCTADAKEYIVELAARLEVMSHRQRALAELIDGLKSKKELSHGRKEGTDRPRSETDVRR
jgi:hypothetical protein